jgi:hypothetical protein
MAVFGSHSISIEAICAPFTVGTVCVPQALQAFPGDRVTVASLRGVDVATTVTRYTGFPRHRGVSIVTICTSVSKMESRIKSLQLLKTLPYLQGLPGWLINQTGSFPDDFLWKECNSMERPSQTSFTHCNDGACPK